MGFAIVLTLIVVVVGAVGFYLVGPELWRPEL
jgi:hypothetical protein